MHPHLSDFQVLRRGAMGKAGRWIRSFLLGKKDKEKGRSRQTPLSIEAPAPTPAPKEKRRWSFQRAVAGGKNMNSDDPSASMQVRRLSESEIDRKRHAVIIAAAKAAAVDTDRFAEMVVRPTNATTRGRIKRAVEEAAAVKIQSIFRSHLARKALSALKGLVKLQAMVRGHLVRKQTTAMLRSIQSIVMAQARARVHRLQIVEAAQANLHQQPVNRRSPHDSQFQQSYETDSDEEDIKIVEIDHGELARNSKGRNRYSIRQRQRARRDDHGFPVYYNGVPEQYHQFSPAPSAVTDINPRGYGKQFDEFSSRTGMSSPQHLSAASIPDATQTSIEYPYPSYMAKTESSRAKARSQSAPRQRSDSYAWQSSRRRSAAAPAAAEEERSNTRGFKVHHSFSRGSLTSEYQHPWSIKLDHSSMSIKDSECSSTITVLTSTNYTRPLVAYE